MAGNKSKEGNTKAKEDSVGSNEEEIAPVNSWEKEKNTPATIGVKSGVTPAKGESNARKELKEPANECSERKDSVLGEDEKWGPWCSEKKQI